MRKSTILAINEASQIGDARRLAQNIAFDLGFDEGRVGRVAIIVTEVGTNLLKHASGGEIIVQAVETPCGDAFEVIAIDQGPGLLDISDSMLDGHSTTGTLGGGLGAIARLSDRFDIFSEIGKGAVVTARVHRDATPQTAVSPEIGALCIPYPGETVCGDGWSVRRLGHQTLLTVIDGLGHGVGAETATAAALNIFDAVHDVHPSNVLRAMHPALKATRGAVAAVALIDHAEQSVTYCGVGNIVAFIAGGAIGQNLVSLDGTVGYLMPRFHDFKYEWSENSALIMHSDGLSTRYRPDNLSRIIQHSPGLMAASILRDCKRGRDDITVLVAKGGAC